MQRVSEVAPSPGDPRRLAARELVQALMAVKGWVREVGRNVYPEHSTPALIALSLLDRHGPVRVGELADLARLDVSVMSRQLRQLEDQGLVVRTVDPADARAHLLSLSPAGQEVLDEGRARTEAVVVERLAGWDAERLADFAATLHSVVDDLSWHPHTAHPTRSPQRTP